MPIPFINLSPPRIRKGQIIRYFDFSNQLNTAASIGAGWHKRRPIVFLDNGAWCYKTAVVEIVGRRGAHSTPSANSQGSRP